MVCTCILTARQLADIKSSLDEITDRRRDLISHQLIHFHFSITVLCIILEVQLYNDDQYDSESLVFLFAPFISQTCHKHDAGDIR